MVLLTTLVAISACGRGTTKYSRGSASQEPGGISCTMEARSSISVTIRSQAWEQGLSSEPFTISIQGPDREQLIPINGTEIKSWLGSFDEEKGELSVYGDFYEVAGDFTVQILNGPNQEIARKQVTVESGSCHVISEKVTLEIP